jgi:hypothetical protein
VADRRTFRDGDTIWHISEQWDDFVMFYIPSVLFDYLLTQATNLHLPCTLNVVCCFGALVGATSPHPNHCCFTTKKWWQQNDLQMLVFLIHPTLLGFFYKN